MAISRRQFLKYCGLTAGALGIDPLQMGLLEKALSNPDPSAPRVMWLNGSSCTGCSVSLLNRISDRVGEPATVVELLTQNINLIYHATLMASAGDPAAGELQRLYREGNYILVLEGGVPTAFGGHCCVVYSLHGREVTYMEAVQELSAKAAAIVCVGTCASFGGIPRAGSNPTKVVGVGALTGRPTINISGCPANPDWVIWAVVQLILGNPVPLDEDNRPVALYNTTFAGAAAEPMIHDKPCPRNGQNEATSFADCDGQCLINLGCRGPLTKARCNGGWNGVAGVNGTWCIGVNAPCHGCVEKTFPGPEPFYEPYGI